MFLLRADGSVADLKITTSSGDAAWDAAAADSMKRWRFAATSSRPIPVDRWIRNTVIVQVQEPLVLTLGKVEADTRATADSLYTLLKSGADFEAIARTSGAGASGHCGWFLGATDIAWFPQEIREALHKLPVNGVTPPLRVDSRFAIFKRFERGYSHAAP
jgi:TonB family protein